MNDKEDPECVMFLDSMYALGFEGLCYQYRPTHLSTCTGPFISDHCMVISDFRLPTTSVEVKTIQYRDYKRINLDSFQTELKHEFDLLDISCNDVNDLANTYDETTRKVLNNHAPLKKKKVSERKREMWFTPELKEQKKTVRRRERIWKKYHQDHQWMALKYM